MWMYSSSIRILLLILIKTDESYNQGMTLKKKVKLSHEQFGSTARYNSGLSCDSPAALRHLQLQQKQKKKYSIRNILVLKILKQCYPTIPKHNKNVGFKTGKAEINVFL